MRKLVVFSLIIFIGCGKTIYNSQTNKRELKEGTLMEMNSEEYLVKNNVWNLQSTEHFKFYFDKSIDENLKVEVKQSQEDNYSYITELMGIKETESPKLIYFLFKDKNQKLQLTKVNSDAHAIAPNVYYLPQNATGGQEVGHVITQTVWGFIPNNSEFALLIDEGFNFYIDNEKFYNDKLDEFALNYFNENPDFNLIDLTLNEKGVRNNGGHSLEESYVAGSFVKYLIENYGTTKFGQLWRSAVNNKEPNFVEIYGKNLNEIGNEYKNQLK